MRFLLLTVVLAQELLEPTNAAAHPDKVVKGAHMIWNGDHYEPAATYNAGTLNSGAQIALAAATACMALSTVGFLAMAKESTKRFNYVAMAVTGIATFAYLAMFCGAGRTEVDVLGRTRAIYYMRYVDWFFTTPFFLLDLCLLAGADQWDTFYVMLMNAICIACGAVGALTPAVNGAINMFVLGMITFILFNIKLFGGLMSKASQMGPEVGGKYKSVCTITMLVWCAYPVMYYLCELTGSVSEAAEVSLYACLDVFAKCVCGYMLIANHDVLKRVSECCGKSEPLL